MGKQLIKNILREGLLDKLREAGKNPQEKEDLKKTKEKSGPKKNDDRSTKMDYNDVQNYFKKDLSFSQVDVMKKALGWEDDETGANRSLFGKMLHQDRNDEGGLYQFDDDQLDRVRTAIKNKQ